MQKTDVNIARWIEAGFNLYKNNFTTLVLAALTATSIAVGPARADCAGVEHGHHRHSDRPHDRRPDHYYAAAITQSGSQTGSRCSFQRVSLFSKYLSLCPHLGHRHTGRIPFGGGGSHHRAVDFSVLRLCRTGLPDVRSLFDRRQTDGFLAGI